MMSPVLSSASSELRFERFGSERGGAVCESEELEIDAMVTIRTVLSDSEM